jgi:hypothetical protein
LLTFIVVNDGVGGLVDRGQMDALGEDVGPEVVDLSLFIDFADEIC